MPAKSSTGEFIAKSKALHGESKYDYSECVYVSAKGKVWLRCIEHDHRFGVSPDAHINHSTGCAKCTSKYAPSTEEFIERSKAVHGESKYDYSDCVYI